MAARRKARKRAVDILFEADLRGTDPRTTLSQWVERADPPVPEYAQRLVEGVVEHQASIDSLIAAHAQEWSLERMPPVDRTVLRLATFELVRCPDIPAPVAIDEAVELAKQLSTDDSPGFVNGILAAIAASSVEPSTSPG
jgi:transcription antitermination protein NusB